MPMFLYVAKDSDGKSKSEVIEALNEQVLVDKIQAEGYYVISIKPVVEKNLGGVEKKFTKKNPGHNSIKLEDLLVFSRQLATMLEAGVTLLKSLDIIIGQIQSKPLREIAQEVRMDIEQGKSLSQAFAKHPKAFNQFWVSLAEVGEASGTMPNVLNKLADHVERENAFRSTIISALVYPMILFFVCIGAVMFFALVVGPRFEEIFASMHADLPGITKGLLASFNFIKHNLFLLIGGTIAAFIAFKQWVKTPQGCLVWERFLFNMPVVGEIVNLIITERFASQMAILIDSGVPILYSLEITEKLVENRNAALIVAQVRADVSEGEGMGEAMDKMNFFPTMAVQMIKVGEETGELGKMLNHVARFYQSKVESFMKRFGTIIEPFMILFMAVVIGIIVVSIFMPLFKLGQGARPH